MNTTENNVRNAICPDTKNSGNMKIGQRRLSRYVKVEDNYIIATICTYIAARTRISKHNPGSSLGIGGKCEKDSEIGKAMGKMVTKKTVPRNAVK